MLDGEIFALDLEPDQMCTRWARYLVLFGMSGTLYGGVALPKLFRLGSKWGSAREWAAVGYIGCSQA